MFEILLTACLETLSLCQERMLPVGAPSLAACQSDAQMTATAWGRTHGLTVQEVRCTDAAPALAVEEIAPGVFVHQPAHDVPTPQNAGDLANLGFVIGATSVAVIDAGGSRQVGERPYEGAT